jgi:hypothetical protein
MKHHPGRTAGMRLQPVIFAAGTGPSKDIGQGCINPWGAQTAH